MMHVDQTQQEREEGVVGKKWHKRVQSEADRDTNRKHTLTHAHKAVTRLNILRYAAE